MAGQHFGEVRVALGGEGREGLAERPQGNPGRPELKAEAEAAAPEESADAVDPDDEQ